MALSPQLEAVPAGAGAAVMGIGILSVALHLDGLRTPSNLLLVLAVVVWTVLAVVFLARLTLDRSRWASDSSVPSALTAVASTAVLGAAFGALHWIAVASALLVVATGLWALLLPMVFRHWRTPTLGASFLVSVGTQGLSVLAGTIARQTATAWLALAGLVAFAFGLLLYVVVLVRFDYRQLRTGAGDQWIAGGALAIGSLAGVTTMAATQQVGLLPRSLGPAAALELALLVLTLVWYTVLAATELRWPRPRYDLRRWSTVFPLGMLAAACFAVADEQRVHWLRTLAEVLVWPAICVTALTAVGFLRHVRRLVVQPPAVMTGGAAAPADFSERER